MQARIKNPTMFVPGAMQALQALSASLEKSGLPDDEQAFVAFTHLYRRQRAGESRHSAGSAARISE